MLLKASESAVILIDVQEKLTPLISGYEQLIAACEWVLSVATTLGVPLILSEQYPQGLGPTLPELNQLCVDAVKIEKNHFSCAADTIAFKKIQNLKRKQLVLIGIETHVCVLQTALDLLRHDYEVFVVVDAVSSRALHDKEVAIARMQQQGVQVISKEMALFEWAHLAGTQVFKDLSKTFLR